MPGVSRLTKLAADASHQDADRGSHSYSHRRSCRCRANKLGAEGATAVAEALRWVTALKLLDLRQAFPHTHVASHGCLLARSFARSSQSDHPAATLCMPDCGSIAACKPAPASGTHATPPHPLHSRAHPGTRYRMSLFHPHLFRLVSSTADSQLQPDAQKILAIRTPSA